MKRIIIIILLLMSTTASAESTTRIKEIRALYSDYNTKLSTWEKDVFQNSSGGSDDTIISYSNGNDKMIVKTSTKHEFGATDTEYYFLDDEIQFFYSESNLLTTHFIADTVKFAEVQLRYYFQHGKIIKTLKKKCDGIEGHENNPNIAHMKNREINHLEDDDAKWEHFLIEIEDIIKYKSDLQQMFNEE